MAQLWNQRQRIKKRAKSAQTIYLRQGSRAYLADSWRAKRRKEHGIDSPLVLLACSNARHRLSISQPRWDRRSDCRPPTKRDATLSPSRAFPSSHRRELPLNRMRVAGITALGEPVEIFEVDELPPPAEGEVLIDVVAAGIGNWDDLVRLGSWQVGGPAPMALGTSAAGTVAAVGSGVAELRVGDDVMTHPLPLRRHGTWASRLLAPAASVAARPVEASWEAERSLPHSGTHCGSSPRRSSRDRERGLGPRQRSGRSDGWRARPARRGSGSSRDRDRKRQEG